MKFRCSGPTLLFCLLLCACAAMQRSQVAAAPAGASPAAGESVFVAVATLPRLRSAGATILDAREPAEFAAGHIPGAVNAPWHMFVEGEHNGRLLDDRDRLRVLVEGLGVRGDSPVVVYGRWNEAWGEEGRVFWMLEYLGHTDAHVLRGGYQRWLKKGGAPSTVRPEARHGKFVVRPRPELRTTIAELRARRPGDASVVVVDTRERSEYDGATPHGSARGGHIPRAVHFRWRDVFTTAGNLRPADELRASFTRIGIGPDTVVVAYCTGGIRSGFLYAVMRWAGHGKPRNYDGSWWEWAANPELVIEP